ncbi:EAL domain-containing protein [Paenibacillus doosanensis]|uniref:EAL domain-containing protein n=1 Tax=Paenibacillus doosanensis TaxID=1229154 RepID=UPI0021802B38|nr:EAL domain-containing protein [Paenibacillus doosanensis]MCS7460904.1 EAL domain-containing protein [Paenibacillus doosanensis]
MPYEKAGCSFSHVYQPIVYMENREILGFEALIRSNAGHPEQLFETARREDRLFDLDTQSVLQAVGQCSQVIPGQKNQLFVNIYPSTLLHHEFHAFLNELVLRRAGTGLDIVFEINEAIEEFDRWTELLDRGIVNLLHKKAILIAFDDVGEGAISLKQLVDFEPDYIKLSKYFTYGLEHSKGKQRMIRMLTEFCSGGSSELIVEGIENERQYEILEQMGVVYGQGYLFAKPQPLEELMFVNPIL